MRILFFEAFGGGSHLAVAKGFQENSSHRVELHTLPARHWRWRMRSSAFDLAKTLNSPAVRREPYDLLITSSVTDLALVKALTGNNCPPVLLYFHENQWDYPDQKGVTGPGETDLHLAFTNLTSALCAEAIAFNSGYHEKRFWEAAQKFLKKMPSSQPWEALEQAQRRSRVLYPGIDSRFSPPETASQERFSPTAKPRGPLILWNHRWEHDKNPETFREGLRHCRRRDLDFRLALMGENFSRRPEALKEILKEFEDKIAYAGHKEFSEYQAILREADIAVSTTRQENFGLSMAEAILSGCRPLLPHRLCYPELIPPEAAEEVFYQNDEEFPLALEKALLGEPLKSDLVTTYKQFYWKEQISLWDAAAEATRGGRNTHG